MNVECGMDGERIYTHWDCPRCDAPNAGAEQCNPVAAAARGEPVLCDECGSEMVYRGDYGGGSDSGPYNVARITTKSGSFDEECPVSVAEALLDCGTLKSFDGVVRHGDCAEHMYTVLQKRVKSVRDVLDAAKGATR